MSSIAKQLNKVRKAEDNLYQVDAFQRRSLVYDDPRRIETSECYATALQHFNSLMKKDPTLSNFNNTLFASTSIRLQLTSLTPGQKKFIDKEIQSFLCHLSSLLRDVNSLHSIEWLIHKYRINEFNYEDLIRCVLPYHETPIFPKFIQLLQIKQLPQQWSWLEKYINEPMSKLDFSRLCQKKFNLLPFMSSSLLVFADSLKECPSKSNEFCNLFSFTVMDLMSKRSRPSQISKLVEKIQGTIFNGLKRVDCPPLQASMKILILRINESLPLNREIVQSWIRLLLRNCPASKELEHLKIVLKLMHSQEIHVLPKKLEAKREACVEKLSNSERKIYSKLVEESLSNKKNIEEVPEQALERLPDVKAVTEVMEVDEPVAESMLETQDVSKEVSEKKLKKLVRKMEPRELFGDKIWSSFEKALSAKKPDCFRTIFHEIYQINSAQTLKDELIMKQRFLHLIKSFKECLAGSSKSYFPIFDQSLPHLMTLLAHKNGKIRVDALGIIHDYSVLIFQSPDSSLESSNLFLKNLAQNCKQTPEKALEQLASEETHQLLNAEALPQLERSLTSLSCAVLNVLTQEDCHFYPECWCVALQLFSTTTIHEIFASNGVIWRKYLSLIKQPTHSITQEVYTLARQAVSSQFFHQISGQKNQISEEQKHLLEAILEGIVVEGDIESNEAHCLEKILAAGTTNQTESAKVSDRSSVAFMEQLKLESNHLTYCLEYLESKRHFQGASKPLRCRVKQARVSRRSSLGPAPIEDTYLPTALSYLRGLDAVARVLSATIPDLHRHHIQKLESKAKDPLSAPIPKPFAKLIAHGSKSSPTSQLSTAEEELRSKIENASQALADLIQPITQQILVLIEEEKDPAYVRPPIASETTFNDASDSDNGFESNEEDDGCLLPMSFLEMTPKANVASIAQLNMTPGYAQTPASKARCNAAQLRQRASLLKSCIHQLISCLGSIFGLANEERKQALDVATVQFKKGRQSQRLYQIANKSISEGAIANAKLCIQPLFICIETFPPWHTLHQQILICLIELAAMFPLSLCENLMQFIRWVTTASNGRMLKLDDAHNLSLIGRLVSVAVPTLVENSNQPSMVALDVLLTFVDNFPALTDVTAPETKAGRQIARRRMALYCGVIHGLARACVPVSLAKSLEEGTLREEDASHQALQLMHVAAMRAERLTGKKSNALATWLWITTIFFSNKDWTDSDTAESVSIFLVKMFNEFPLQTQILSWCQCLAYLLYLIRNRTSSQLPDTCAPNTKRAKLALESKDTALEPVRRSNRLRKCSTSLSKEQDLDILSPKSPLCKRRRTFSMNEPDQTPVSKGRPTSDFASPPLMEVQNFNENECVRLGRMLVHQNQPEESMDYAITPATPISSKRSAGAIVKSQCSQERDDAFSSWPLVARITSLVHAVLSSPSHAKRIEHHLKESTDLVSDMYGRLVHHSLRMMAEASKPVDFDNQPLKETLSSLQASLVKIQECVKPNLYIRMLSELLDRPQADKAERQLLTRKLLELLSAKLNHLVNVFQRKGITRLDKALEDTLIDLLHRCHRILMQSLNETSSALSRALLACLIHLIKLLGNTYPNECIKLIECALSEPQAWWHKQAQTDAQPNGTHFAESRSLLCQLLLKSLEKLNIWLNPLWHSLGPRMLQLAADHCSTSARITDRPEFLHTLLSCPEICQSGDNAAAHVINNIDYVSGAIHYRDQHLLAGLNLLFAVMQFSVIRQYSVAQRTSYTTDSDQLECCLDEASAVNDSSALLRFRPEALPMLHQAVKKNAQLSLKDRTLQLMSGQLLVLVCRLCSLDIAQATGCKPERSAVQLTHLNQLMVHLRHCMLQSPGITQLLFSIYTLVKYANQLCDWELFIGVCHVLATFGEALPSSYPVAIYSENVHPENINSVAKLNSTMLHKPELLFHLSQLLFVKSDQVQLAGYKSVSVLLKTLDSPDVAGSILKKLVSWAPNCKHVGKHSVDMDSTHEDAIGHVGVVVDRLTNLLNVLSELAPKELQALVSTEGAQGEEGSDSSPEVAKFLELCRTAETPVFLLDLLFVLTQTNQKKKLIKRVSSSGSTMQEFVTLLVEQCPSSSNNKNELPHPAKFHPEETRALVEMLLSVMACWLRAEHLEGDSSLTNLLCIASNAPSGADVSHLATSLVAVLDLCHDPEDDTTPLLSDLEEKLSPVLNAYLDMSMNDEALLRPLCASLCQRLQCFGSEAGGIYGVSHWKTRLACIHLLRKVYEHILETDRLGQEAMDSEDREARMQKLSVASCLVNDTLAGLQEALQDDRSEVEEAANRLFADLETAGVLSR